MLVTKPGYAIEGVDLRDYESQNGEYLTLDEVIDAVFDRLRPQHKSVIVTREQFKTIGNLLATGRRGSFFMEPIFLGFPVKVAERDERVTPDDHFKSA